MFAKGRQDQVFRKNARESLYPEAQAATWGRMRDRSCPSEVSYSLSDTSFYGEKVLSSRTQHFKNFLF